jgi:predicted nucleic acid-binding protein
VGKNALISKIFVDRGFVLAKININDQYHQEALKLLDRFESLPWVTTEAI